MLCQGMLALLWSHFAPADGSWLRPRTHLGTGCIILAATPVLLTAGG